MASQSIVTQGTNLGVLSICQKFGNFRRNSNGKVHFNSVRLEYSKPTLEVAHFDLSDRSEQNLLFRFDKLVHFPSSLQ